jgi:hypothetical protein
MFYYFFLLFLPNYCGIKIMSYLCTAIEKSSMRPDGGIGRRAGLKHQWIHFHPGSTPGLGTEAEKVEILSPLFFSTPRNSLVIPKFALIFIVRVVGDGYFYFCS